MTRSSRLASHPSDEEQLHIAIQAAVLQELTDAQGIEAKVSITSQANWPVPRLYTIALMGYWFELAVNLDLGEFCYVHRNPNKGRTESTLDFEIADPDSIKKAAEALALWGED